MRSTYDRAQELRGRRDETIVNYHVALGGGLACPVCREWSPVTIDRPQGIRIDCRECGAVVIMPRVPLFRAIAKMSRVR